MQPEELNMEGIMDLEAAPTKMPSFIQRGKVGAVFHYIWSP